MFLRLYLLQGIRNYHSGNGEEAREYLDKVRRMYSDLCHFVSSFHFQVLYEVSGWCLMDENLPLSHVSLLDTMSTLVFLEAQAGAVMRTLEKHSDFNWTAVSVLSCCLEVTVQAREAAPMGDLLVSASATSRMVRGALEVPLPSAVHLGSREFYQPEGVMDPPHLQLPACLLRVHCG